MNIYHARRLQQLLYKQAEVEFKTMRVSVSNGELFYWNLVKLSARNGYVLQKSFLKSISESIDLKDLITEIQYHENTIYNSGDGLYLLQLIKID